MADALDWDRVRLPGGKTKLIRITDEGEWSILPISYAEGDEEWQSWHLGFRPAHSRPRHDILREFETHRPKVFDRAYWYTQAEIGYDVARHGEFWYEQSAIAAVNSLVFAETSGTVEEILEDAGFTQHGETHFDNYRGQIVPERNYQKAVEGGKFVLDVGTSTFLRFYCGEKLTIDDEWEIAYISRNEGDVFPFPIFWPPRIEENFSILALRAMLNVMNSYVSSGRFADDIHAHSIDKPGETVAA